MSREYQNYPNSYLLFTKVSMHFSISHSLCSAVHNYDSLCSAVHNYDSLCRGSSRSPIMLSILLVINRKIIAAVRLGGLAPARPIINPRRACAARVTVVVLCVCLSVCLSVCLFVYYYSRTTGYEAAYERYQQIQCYKGRKNNVAILLKRLRSRDMA